MYYSVSQNATKGSDFSAILNQLSSVVPETHSLDFEQQILLGHASIGLCMQTLHGLSLSIHRGKGKKLIDLSPVRFKNVLSYFRKGVFVEGLLH